MTTSEIKSKFLNEFQAKVKQIYNKIDTNYMGTCNKFEANLEIIKKEIEANFSAIQANFGLSKEYYTEAKFRDNP